MEDNNKIQLLVRADDMGSSHAANLACIEAYQNGIVRSVELMVPCPWFEEACTLLNQHPDLDVGIHLTLTSEWDGIKWGPLTHAPSLEEEPGQFFPMLYSSDNFPQARALKHQNWKLEEVEQEFRAQIELGLKRVPHASHITHHMALDFIDFDEEIGLLSNALAKEYGLHIPLATYDVQYFDAYQRGGKESFEAREQTLINKLNVLKPGKYFFIDHPALDNAEMRAIKHKGYEHASQDRYNCLRVFTSERVLAAIGKMGIELISYKEVFKD